MDTAFETQKNKKAFAYTTIICAILLLLAFIVTWPVSLPATHISEDLMEINLGNNEEGPGDVQPLIKGNMAPAQKPVATQAAPPQESNTTVTPEEEDNNEAAAIEKNIKKNPVTIPQPVKQPATNHTAVVMPQPKQEKPRFTYSSPSNGKGNGATEDNGYTYQGNKPGGTGDAGDPSGNADSYGNTPGGKTGGARVTSGDRKITRHYSFTGDLDKATIYATIKVSP